MSLSFHISNKQAEQINKWKAELDRKTLEIQKTKYSTEEFNQLTSNGKFPYYGAIGGELTYSFTFTGLGTVLKVEHGYTGDILDVTDYENW